MKKTTTLLLTLMLAWSAGAQLLVDFEEFNIAPDEFLNGSNVGGGFSPQDNTGRQFFFPNDYDPMYDAWSGWAISSMTDTLTPGFGNQYSAIAGQGADGSQNYVVSFVAGSSGIRLPEGFNFIYDFSLTNNTYAYYSMLEGDAFSKKFGGADGTDPDFFLLTIKGWLNGLPSSSDSVDFYLADYRFNDGSQDYIVKDWTSIDLNSLQEVDSLSFTLSSSDVGVFGMNTPAYFCLDNIHYDYILGASNDKRPDFRFKTFPNPVADMLFIDWQEACQATVYLFNTFGQLLQEEALVYGQQSLAVDNLPQGLYYLKVQTEKGWVSKPFVKN